jgi:hypothetical protein
MEFDLIPSNLNEAIVLPGCPICNVQRKREVQHIGWLARDHANDPATRTQFMNALNYCHHHTWEIGLAEMHMFGHAIGNNVIYRYLAGVMQKRLNRYSERAFRH